MNRGAGCFGFNGRMVVIFGFGAGSPEDQGEVAPCVCPNCHNQVFLHHIRSKKSVRLYFVPVVPYGTENYLVCPVCSRGLQVGDAQLRHVRSMSAATASFRAGRLSQAQYMAQADRFWRQLGVNPAGQQPVTPASPGAPAQPAIPVPSPAPAQPPPGTEDDEASWLAQLRKLAQLHDQGVLSDAAFAAAKQRILEQGKQLPVVLAVRDFLALFEHVFFGFVVGNICRRRGLLAILGITVCVLVVCVLVLGVAVDAGCHGCESCFQVSGTQPAAGAAVTGLECNAVLA